ncbi:glycoside hydrolase family 16 protein [Halopelagius fulvigenes]|uniref:Family 16 glycosylhydrolase n=1 Tax=Halopelagius fulvigenes TaxID=1198324 RepID=A0ABD5TX00_9EURY
MTRRQKTDEREENEGEELGRRDYLKLAATGVVASGGLGLSTASTTAATDGGPPNPDNWTLNFEDTFDGGSLDTSKWSVGYGWGLTDRNSAGRVSSDEVNVSNGQLHLSMRYDGSVTTSAVNTKDKHYYGPGSYWEASIKLPGRTGVLPAFWSKPNTEEWPPELDFIEIFQNDGGREDTHRAEYHIHYSTSTVSDDSSTHESLDVEYDSSTDLTEGFHVYGCRWLEDRVDFYFDGINVGTITDSTAMEALRNGGPQYMMLTNMIDKVGTTDKSTHWSEEMVVDWVRVWTSGSSSDGSTDETTEDATDETTDDTEHYFWVRADSNDPVTYAFEASGGNISVDSGELSTGESDEWISSDGTLAGGVEDNSGGDGFRYHGEIIDFAHDAPVETYIDDQYVDPDTLVDPNSPGPEQPTDETDDGGSSSLPHTITFDGNGGGTTYSVTVSDTIEPAGAADGGDSVSGSTAAGSTGSGSDSFGFSGEITSLSLDGDADVSVDGQRVDMLVINRASGKNSVRYIVETAGRVIKADVPFASINSNDKVRGGKISGKVGSGTDAYWIFGGDIVDVSTFGGEVTTELNGDVVDYTD